MSVSLSDILTAAKDIVTGVNAIAQNYLNVQGALSRVGIAVTTQVRGGAGRVCRVSVTTAGSTAGTIYDSPNQSTLAGPIYSIPMNVDVFEVNITVSYGILVVPGTDQVLTVVYS